MESYHFGVPKILIWLVHISVGVYFLWLGYTMTKFSQFKIHGLVILVLGALMATYHAHLWFYNLKK